MIKHTQSKYFYAVKQLNVTISETLLWQSNYRILQVWDI
jgi:hypothetical protein